MANERFSLKDHLFNREKVSYLGGLLSAGVPGFDSRSFERAVMDEMLELELKERIALIARVLEDHLDDDFETAAAQIEASLPPPLDPSLTDDDFGDFIIAPFGKYVEDHGLDDFEASMHVIKELTKRFSMEGTIRPFINKHTDATIGQLTEWADDDNYHVRRLVSEGTRPTLPWSPRIVIEVERPLPLLDRLHADATRYVTRSVANHLNDISKIAPTLVIERLEDWKAGGRQTVAELAWMEKHALRTLIKRGDPAAMGLLGYSPDPTVEAALTVSTPIVVAGEALEFAVSLDSPGDEPVIVGYVIDFVKKSGETKPKVFKLKQTNLVGGKAVVLNKRHPLRADATTYTLYEGTHGLTVVVNGKPVGSTSFEVRL